MYAESWVLITEKTSSRPPSRASKGVQSRATRNINIRGFRGPWQKLRPERGRRSYRKPFSVDLHVRQLKNARRYNANNVSCLTMLNDDARSFIASNVHGSRRHCCTTRAVSRRKKCATSWPIGCEGGGARECASIHAVVPDVLYLLRVAWCVFHALYRARAAYAAVTFLRSCMRRGMALGWTRSRGDL